MFVMYLNDKEIMETYYWKPTLEEAKKFITWGYTEEPFAADRIVREFYKRQVPIEVQYPSKSYPQEVIKAKEWWAKTNEEDLFILEAEHKAFIDFYTSEKVEIVKHIKINNTL
jgi:hypothetical protein